MDKLKEIASTFLCYFWFCALNDEVRKVLSSNDCNSLAGGIQALADIARSHPEVRKALMFLKRGGVNVVKCPNGKIDLGFLSQDCDNVNFKKAKFNLLSLL